MRRQDRPPENLEAILRQHVLPLADHDPVQELLQRPPLVHPHRAVEVAASEVADLPGERPEPLPGERVPLYRSAAAGVEDPVET